MLEKSLVEVKSLTTTFDGYEVEIAWDLTMRCNYSCSYCESYNNTDPLQFLPLDAYFASLKYLREYLGNKNAKIDVLGGEPMLFKQWDKLLNEMHRLSFVPKLTTNLSIKTKTLEKKISELEPKNCIDVSWHPQFADEKNIIENIKLLYDSKHLRTISILADKRYWKKVKKAFKSVEYTNKTELSFIKDESAGKNKIAHRIMEYTTDEINFINSTRQQEVSSYNTEVVFYDGSKKQISNLTEFFTCGITNFKGLNCEVGKSRLHIKPNGDVYPSACLLNYPQARMGNIFKQQIIKPNNPIKCPFSFCGCGPDMRINKYA